MRVLAFLLLLLAAPALSHGDASWIMTDPDTRWCCGPGDCFELHDVARSRAGWTFPHPRTGAATTVPYTFRARYPSINAHFWVCIQYDGAVRCFFTAPDGV